MTSTSRVTTVIGRKTSETDAEDGETIYAYDSAGLLETLTDPEGNVTAWTYDAAGRTIEEENELADSRFFEYDAGGPTRPAPPSVR